jgi:cysteine sulfinate desulfinase/cysteine desulfurase-like protein
MWVASEIADASLRFSFSKRNSAQDVDRVVHEFPKAVSKVRELTEKLSR